MSFYYLNQIWHNDELVREKVNYFADYFNFIVNCSRTLDSFQLENHLSIIEKIIFQAETNNANCLRYIQPLLKSNFFQIDNEHFKEYKNYNLVIPYFNLLRTADGGLKDLDEFLKAKQESIKEFLKALKRFRTELKKMMFKKSLNNIISYLICKHPLSEHIESIEYDTQILVSEFFLNKNSRSDILDVFSKIITHEEKTFPFPPSFLKRNRNNLKQAKKDFISNRNFKEQFEGIFNYFKSHSNRKHHIFLIKNLKGDEKVSFKYGKVNFYGTKHEKLRSLLNHIDKKAILNSPILENVLFAVVKTKNINEELIELGDISSIRDALNFINSKLETHGTLDTHSYFFTSDFKNYGHVLRAKSKRVFSQKDSLSLKRNNIYQVLLGSKSELKGHFLNQESTYNFAKATKNIPAFWQYLENLFYNINNSQKIIQSISKILVLSLKENDKDRMKEYFINACSNSSESLTQIDYHTRNKLSNTWNFNLNGKNLEHPFINRLHKKIQSPIYDSELKKAQEYYTYIFTELYSVRNSKLHANLENEVSLVRLSYKLPLLISRLRKTLIEASIENPKLDMKDLCQKLVSQCSNQIRSSKPSKPNHPQSQQS